MSACFLCLTAEGGVPLFYRTKGNIKPLPFPIIGSLNGVHMFCKSHAVNLKAASTDDSTIVWKDYHNSLSLIVITQDDGHSDSHITRLLDYCFQAMVLVYGLEDLTNIKNVERFKREIKVCYKLIDQILEHTKSSISSSVTHCVDLIAGPENLILQNYIDAFAEAADSPYGCLMVSGKVAVATAKWWELSASELILLTMLVSSLPQCSSRDVAVFLPVSSPTVPHRLLTFQLVPGVEVCVICGPTPQLADLETEVDRYWRPSVDSLRSLQRLHPRNFPSNIALDGNVLGFMLLNLSHHRCLCSVHPHGEDTSRRLTGKPLSSSERAEILLTFYKSVMGSVWSLPPSEESSQEKSLELNESLSHTVTDTYTCTERHKCYALQSAQHLLLVLFSPNLPTYSMRSVAQKTLQVLIKDRCVLV